MKKIENKDLGRLTVEEFSVAKKRPIILIADNIRSSNNVGSLFRTADAFAIEQVWLCGITATPPDREIHKTALGAELTVQWRKFATTVEPINELKSMGYTAIAVEQVEGACSLEGFTPPNQGCGLVLGNEVKGVDQEVVDMCDMAIEIPQWGTKHSLNVSVSAGVVLWQCISKDL
jgi:tRNA G18 (ribose-2'-O)-methylase SpoU